MAEVNKRVERLLAKNVLAIQALKPADKQINWRIKGEPSLFLAVHPTGRKVWFTRYQIGKGAGRQRGWKEIGPFPTVTLEKACKANRATLAGIDNGVDPGKADLTTFGALFSAWMTRHAKPKLDTWSDEQRRYELHLEKPLAKVAFEDITREHVRSVRDAVSEAAGGVQSNRVVALFNRVANWAVDEGYAKFNPAAKLRKVGKEQRRERVLTEEEVSNIWAELDRELVPDVYGGGLNEVDLPAAVAVRRAIKLLMICGQRRSEVIEIERTELNLQSSPPTWTIKGARTKNKLPHRVPLTPMAVQVIQDALRDAGDSPYLFPSTRTEGPISGPSVTKALGRICRRCRPKIEGVGPHDIRRTIGTAMRKLGVSVEDRGHVFNHVSGAKSKVTSWNYDAGEHDAEKLAALQRWERELRRILGLDGQTVVHLGGDERQ